MASKFLPPVSIEAIKQAQAMGDDNALYDLLVQPLHEELYVRQTFDFLDDLSDGQQLLIGMDYLRMQVGQGGFIQFIHNGYIGLLPALVEQLNKIGANDMAQVLDDVLKVYVLNREILDKATTVEEFALLYDELKEFEQIDERFSNLMVPTIRLILSYAITHITEFVTIIESV